MVNSRERSGLRHLLDGVVSHHLSGHTHATLDAAFTDPAMSEVSQEEGSLRVRLERSYAQVSDDDLSQVAQHILPRGNLTAATRNGRQDPLWARSSPPETPKRIRRELARPCQPFTRCPPRRSGPCTPPASLSPEVRRS
ncbi:hypothetical protein [Streptomyces shenzhenensis]|uniref:hypothetical protein n=1 Tax=Streptomyces shenzhenensis TaxID=943815 RepID=UPI001C808C86|nr:hypothetical protein [Streptomyces shenzhenensis]